MFGNTKTEENAHNAIRNVINAEGKGLGFLAEKEVAMPQFDHRADNLLTDLETGKLPYAIDVTIRACHQQSLPTVERVANAAVKEKQKEFATKDDNGRKTAEVFVVPFVMTSMGNIDQGAAKFLKSLTKRDPFKAKKNDGFDFRPKCKVDRGTFTKVLGISQQDNGSTYRKGVLAAAQRPEA